MNVIIVGAGKVGSYLTSKLSDEGHNILVIEKNNNSQVTSIEIPAFLVKH